MDSQKSKRPTVVVVGGGHAGIEASLAASRRGVRVVLVTLVPGAVGRMPCNPAVGGQAKGHLVREIDALGGAMATAADAATIQFKYLNTRKGLAVRSSRAQVDRHLYQAGMVRLIRGHEHIKLLRGEAIRLVHRSGRCEGVVLADGTEIKAAAVILTAGTFLRSRLHTGMFERDGSEAGRFGQAGLSDSLSRLGHRLARLKTGTVPRLDGRTIDWSVLAPQDGDHPGGRFSFSGLPQLRCRVIYTNERTHAALHAGLRHSPLYGPHRRIDSTGPRYCPSIEDKIHRFPDKERHRIFLEPEGLTTCEVYPNGLSTSLPVVTQQEALRTMEGLSQVRIVRPGYAIEYDYSDPRDLTHGLQSQLLSGLFLAGQLNGTTGYEEAAGQGLLAGANAAALALGQQELIVDRSEGYLGVLVDDLVTRGTTEPYRMFTSRAEWRLVLREDNADLRLTPIGRALGLVDDTRWATFEARRTGLERGREWLRSRQEVPGGPMDTWLTAHGHAPLLKPTKLGVLLRRHELTFDLMLEGTGRTPPELSEELRDQLSVEFRYEGYIRRQREAIERMRDLKGMSLPEGMVFVGIPGLRPELVEKLEQHRPATLGDAAALPGMTPAAIALLAARVQRLGLLGSAEFTGHGGHVPPGESNEGDSEREQV